MQNLKCAVVTTALAAVLIATTAPQRAQAADVVVHRGSQVQVESERVFRSNATGRVAVQRGQPPARKPPPKSTSLPSRVISGSGDTLWVIDKKRGRLTGCTVIGSSNVGQNRIRCATRRTRTIGTRRTE